jgi:polar amino acid transport system substrate-binding protein
MFHKLLVSIVLILGMAQAALADLKVGVSGDYPPLIYKQDGRLVGIEADSVKAIGDILGQQMTMVEMPFENLIPALKAGEIDVIMSGMSITPERSEQVAFVEPYMEIGQMAIMSTEKVGLFSKPWSIYGEGVRIGVEPGTTGAAFAQEKLTDAEIHFYTDSAAAFAGLRNDEVDLYVHDAPTSWQLATSPQDGDLISLYQPLTEEHLAWAVRKDDQALLAELNLALRTIKGNGTLRYILNRWIPVTVEVR